MDAFIIEDDAFITFLVLFSLALQVVVEEVEAVELILKKTIQ